MNWIVVTIKPNQSKKAELNLLAQNFKVFFPRLELKIKEKLVRKDLFPGYAFVQVEDLSIISKINSTKGISRVMRVGDRIPTISNKAITEISSQMKFQQLDLNSCQPHQVNDKVLITFKLLSDQEAEIINIVDQGSTQKFLLKLLNSNYAIWLNGEHISKI